MPVDESFSLTMDLEDGYRFLVDFEQDGVPGLLMDEPEPLGDGSGPNAARVLAAAIGTQSVREGIKVDVDVEPTSGARAT